MDRFITLNFPTWKLRALEGKIKREDQLMSYLWNDGDISELASNWMEDYQYTKESRSIAKAQVWKNTGNKQFQAKNYSESIQSYTQCAMYAPEHSPELSVAIANRSASLFFLNRYKDCMKDIELAIQLNYPKELHYKLHLRKLQCYLKLGNTDLAKQMISKIRESIDDPSYIAPSMKDDIEKRISGITFNGPCTPDESKNIDDPLDLRSMLKFDENPNFPNASLSIDRKSNEEPGSHVIANRFIRKGEVLFIEKPVSFKLLNDYAGGRICQQCNRLCTDVPVPCSKCVNTFYCDTNCLNEAWSSYHRWECPGTQMGLWKRKPIGHLALKVLLLCTTTTDTFNEMQNFKTNFDKLPMLQLVAYGTQAAMLTSYLLERTDFFQRNDINDLFARKFVNNSFNFDFHAITNDNKHIYVSSLLLRFCLQVYFHSSSISKSSIQLSEDDLTIDQEITRDIVALGIYPSASMMSHSCDGNIVMNFIDQYQVVRALKDIAANEEILICYGLHYRFASTEERQKQLLSQYYFTCKCKPCTQPNLKYFVERFTAMNCSKCNGALCNIKNKLFCLDCFDKPRHFQRDKIKQAEKLFKEAKDCIVRENAEVALKKLEKCLNIRRRMLYKSNEDIVSTLHVISKLYMAKGKLEDVNKCRESIIAAVIERFGSSSVELMDMLFKLVNIALPYLALTRDTTTRSYRVLLTTTYEYLEQVEKLIDLNFGSLSNVYKTYKHRKDTVYNYLHELSVY
ncbi:protein-lysine N-methyltransferase SMYD4-like isoform X2 [Lasioglossum baleicum]|uniref:protein-lysine N-methyltransferase SMYD4-like isoform X2 n=1 Tax=Lasioglossum baleicum TaxID=434251 RepID=UPI003FCCF755